MNEKHKKIYRDKTNACWFKNGEPMVEEGKEQ